MMNGEGNSNLPEIPDSSNEFLLYMAENGKINVQVRVWQSTVWLNQKEISQLYHRSIKTINEHIISIFDEGELSPGSTIRKFRIVQQEGKRDIERDIDYFNLDMILAVGYRVKSSMGTRFRQWATQRLSEFLVKGFVLDDERIKAGRGLTDDYFDELLERIRDIRASERLFYQKITDIYTTSIDYDKDNPTTQQFFATVQNKLHWAIHHHTAAEIIKERANAELPTMGLTTWKNAPQGRIRKADTRVAKNYLTAEEISNLNQIVTAYLEFAELQARSHKCMYMTDWVNRLDAFLNLADKDILKDAGRVSKELAEEFAESQYMLYDERRRRFEVEFPVSDFDEFVEKAKQLKPHKKPDEES